MSKYHSFEIHKSMKSSAGNIIANYLDLEHACAVHPGFDEVSVLSETSTAACLKVTVSIWGMTVSSVSYYEYRPPCQIFNVMRSPIGVIQALSSISEEGEGDKKISKVCTQIKLELPWYFYPFRKILEWKMKRFDITITEEDKALLERRYELFGDYIGDYLRPQQYLLFKEAYQKSFSQHTQKPLKMKTSEPLISGE